MIVHSSITRCMNVINDRNLQPILVEPEVPGEMNKLLETTSNLSTRSINFRRPGSMFTRTTLIVTCGIDRF